MSGIGGAWLPDCVEHPRALAQRLESALVGRGPDGTGHHWQAPIALVNCLHETTPDAHGATQPRVADDGTALVWDGRLDGVDALSAALGRTGDHSDRDWVLMAYRHWGPSCCEHLEGDFAFAIWDPRRQALVLARDRLGVRPLFFSRGRHGTIFASTLEAVLAGARLARRFDEVWFAGYFGAKIDATRTPYRDITAVAPASFVVLDAEGVRARVYWRPRPAPTPSLKDQEHEARFACCFQQAVADRLRADGPVGAELSGGLDSSSIVGVAEALGTSTLLPVSVTSDNCPTADERSFIRAVEQGLGIESRRFRHEDHPPYGAPPPYAYDTPGAIQSTGARDAAIDHWLSANGARVLLRGHGGDQLLWSQIDVPPALADLATRGQLRRLVASLSRWSTRQKRPLLPLLAMGVLYPLLPRGIRRRIGPDAPRVPTLLDPRFVRRTDLRRRSFWEQSLPRRRGLVSSQERLADALSISTPMAWSYDRGPGATEPRYPFLDRRLIELCLGLPLDQLIRGDETRSIQRRAMRGYLPEAVRTRHCKAAFDEVVIRSLRADGARLVPLLRAPRVCDLGIVDGDALRASFDRNRHGIHDNTSILRQVLDLELWLRGHDPAADPSSPPTGTPRAPLLRRSTA